MARSRATAIAAVLALVVFFSYLLLPGGSHTAEPNKPAFASTATITKVVPTEINGFATTPGSKMSAELLHGVTIMPKLGNETIKAELGRASWKLLHTTLARFPKKPTADEREALNSYLHLFARLYPCGECATHFQLLLKQFRPQTSSRDAASQWGCHIHNLVNERLGKAEFDCGSVTDTYKCGCADADADADANADTDADAEKGDVEKGDVDLLDANVAAARGGARVEVLHEGLMNGG